MVNDRCIETLEDFFHGTSVSDGQYAFWPYDFGIIPIETISAIYERFLQADDQDDGAFYTPRFLADSVLEIALEGMPSVSGKRFLDPACGSGIFLVGLFNRIAEEWKRDNPRARNDRKATELMQLLRGSIFGADINPTACRITAFSLYLAYLDQLSPRDIQALQEKGQALPRLIVSQENERHFVREGGNISCGDFFSDDSRVPKDMSMVIGNPPWRGRASADTPAGRWCSSNHKVIPNKQIACAFIWKAADHVQCGGRICFVLPYGTLFNHGPKAVEFQKSWLSTHTIERVLNLGDFRYFLFEEAKHPAVVVRYNESKPASTAHRIDYWAPKTDWTVAQAEIISVSPLDRTSVSLGAVLKDLDSPDAPQIWTQRLWATPRDLRFLDRLSLYPRLRDLVRKPQESDTDKPWVMAEGFQPLGSNDDPEKARVLALPTDRFITAKSKAIDLFLLKNDCQVKEETEIEVRSRSNTYTNIYCRPHVLVTQGFRRIAFADFDVAFRHAIRGIHGPLKHRPLLVFLTAYLRSHLARYFEFHTSASWGIYRPKIHVAEVQRLPMPMPDQQPDPTKSWSVVGEVVNIFDTSMSKAKRTFLGRKEIVAEASEKIEPLIYEYFDVHPLEKILIEDTIKIAIPSVQPNHKKMPVPSIALSSTSQQELYRDRLCDVLNGWAQRSSFIVRGETYGSSRLGVGMVVLEKVRRSQSRSERQDIEVDLLPSLNRLRQIVSHSGGRVVPVRGLMVFDRDKLFIVKPMAQRHWSQTAALNDADEIGANILTYLPEEMA